MPRNEDYSFPMSDEWRLAVRGWMEDRGWSNSALAQHLGVSNALISQLLTTDKEAIEAQWSRRPLQTSQHAITISELTGVPLPLPTRNPRIASLMQLILVIEKSTPAFLERMEDQLQQHVEKLREDQKNLGDAIGRKPDTASHDDPTIVVPQSGHQKRSPHD